MGGASPGAPPRGRWSRLTSSVRGRARPGGRPGGERPDAPAEGRRRRPLLLALAVLVVGAVPLAVGVVAMGEPRWYPVLDWAQTELRVRDVGTGATPLVGLPGRLDALGEVGSHPGPMSFYALAPVYRLAGASPGAMLLASAVLQLLALATAVWIAHRRGGLALAAGTVAVLALLVHAYGAERLAVPWNPWLPLLWWFVLLLAVWSLVCGDLPVLPVAVVAGSFCAQTHVSYAGLVAGLGVLTLPCLVAIGWRRRRDRALVDRARRWSLLGIVLLAVLWLPPVLQELSSDPGNLSIIRARFAAPIEGPVGLSQGLEAWLGHLDVTGLLTGTQRLDGAPAPGLLLLAGWAVAVRVAWRRRDRRLLALHGTVAAALLLGLVSITRILGQLWDYLVLWSWGTTALLLLAIGATVAAEGSRPPAPGTRRGSWVGRRPVVAAAGSVAVVAVMAATVDAARAEPPFPAVSRTLGEAAHRAPTPAETAQLQRFRQEVVAALSAHGRDDLLPLLDTNLFGLSVDPRLPDELVGLLHGMRELSAPTSLFVAPAP